jgi:hypothetical protein
VLRQESEGEVTQGETALSTVVTESYSGSHFDAKRGASKFEAPLFLPFGSLKALSSIEGLKAYPARND